MAGPEYMITICLRRPTPYPAAGRFGKMTLLNWSNEELFQCSSHKFSHSSSTILRFVVDPYTVLRRFQKVCLY